MTAAAQQTEPLTRKQLFEASVWVHCDVNDEAALEAFTEFMWKHGAELVALALASLGRIERTSTADRDAVMNYVLARLSRGPLTTSAIFTPVLAEMREHGMVHHTADNHWVAGPEAYGAAAETETKAPAARRALDTPPTKQTARASKRRRCGECGETGHNRATCTKERLGAPPAFATAPARKQALPTKKPVRPVPPAPEWMAKPLKPPGKLDLDEVLERKRIEQGWTTP